MSTVDSLFHKKLVTEEQTNPDDGKDDINLGTKYASLFVYSFVSGKCFVLGNSLALHHAEHSIAKPYLVSHSCPELSPLRSRSLDFGLASLLYRIILFLLYRF